MVQLSGCFSSQNISGSDAGGSNSSDDELDSDSASDSEYPLPQGTLLWAKRAGGWGGYDVGHGLAVLPGGVAVVTGSVGVEAIFGEGEPNETIVDSQGNDIFVAKYRADGILDWVKRAGQLETEAGGTPGDDVAFAAEVMADGTSVITGSFRNVAAFGIGESGQTLLTEYPCATEAEEHPTCGDLFMARFRSDGTLLHAAGAGGDSSDYGKAIELLADGSTVVLGLVEPNPDNRAQRSGPTQNLGLYGPDGTLRWIKQLEVSVTRPLSLTKTGSILVAGLIFGATTFGQGEPNETTLDPGNSCGVILAEFALDGHLVRALLLGHIEKICGYNTPVYDLSASVDNGVIISGAFSGETVFGKDTPNEISLTAPQKSSHGYIAKFNNKGALLWARTACGAIEEKSFQCYLRALAEAEDGSVVATGWYETNHVKTIADSLSPPRDSAYYTVKFTPSGEVAWSQTAAESVIYQKKDMGLAIGLSRSGEVVVTGYFSDVAVFGKGEKNETQLTSAGGYDIFIAKYVL
ncbi:MAG: hypothetical protein QNJ97_25505 [Myxococcota bacterium]|nr:hypothetical protein [Myxococcota bacterium]